MVNEQQEVRQSYAHTSGRVCTYDEDSHAWRYKSPKSLLMIACPWRHDVRSSMKDEVVEPIRVSIQHHTMPAPTVIPHVEFPTHDEGSDSINLKPGIVWYSQAMPVMKVYEDCIEFSYGMDGRSVDAVTDDARYILGGVLPSLLETFLQKNAQYARAQTGHDLGLKGIIPDINRKSAAIISRVWDADQDINHVMNGEGGDSTRELLEDLIGHCLLMLAKMRDLDEEEG